jgi:hypothetical protein
VTGVIRQSPAITDVIQRQDKVLLHGNITRCWAAKIRLTERREAVS